MAKILTDLEREILYGEIDLAQTPRKDVSIGFYGFGRVARKSVERLLEEQDIRGSKLKEVIIFTSDPQHNIRLIEDELRCAYHFEDVFVIPIAETYRHLKDTDIMLITGGKHRHDISRIDMTIANYPMINGLAKQVYLSGQAFDKPILVVSNSPDLLCLSAANLLNQDEKHCDERKIVGLADLGRMRAINVIERENAQRPGAFIGKRMRKKAIEEKTVALGPHGMSVVFIPDNNHFSEQELRAIENKVNEIGPGLVRIGEDTTSSTATAIMNTIGAMCDETTSVCCSTLFPYSASGKGIRKSLVYTSMPVQFFGGRAVINEAMLKGISQETIKVLEERIRDMFMSLGERSIPGSYLINPIEMRDAAINSAQQKAGRLSSDAREHMRKRWARIIYGSAIAAGSAAAAMIGTGIAYDRMLEDYGRGKIEQAQQYIENKDYAHATGTISEMRSLLRGRSHGDLRHLYIDACELDNLVRQRVDENIADAAKRYSEQKTQTEMRIKQEAEKSREEASHPKYKRKGKR